MKTVGLGPLQAQRTQVLKKGPQLSWHAHPLEARPRSPLPTPSSPAAAWPGRAPSPPGSSLSPTKHPPTLTLCWACTVKGQFGTTQRREQGLPSGDVRGAHPVRTALCPPISFFLPTLEGCRFPCIETQAQRGCGWWGHESHPAVLGWWYSQSELQSQRNLYQTFNYFLCRIRWTGPKIHRNIQGT